jgi:hypothetical protein
LLAAADDGLAGYPAELFNIDGDSAAVRQSAHGWAEFGLQACESGDAIRALDTSLFVGPEGDQYRAGLSQDLAPRLDRSGEAYTKVGSALASFADALTAAQDRMAPWTVRAPNVWADLQAARSNLFAAQSADAAHIQHDLDQSMIAPVDLAGTRPRPDGYVSYAVEASVVLSSAQEAWNECVGAAREVRSELTSAIDACCRMIKDAEGMRFAKNPGFIGSVAGGASSLIKGRVSDLAGWSASLERSVQDVATAGYDAAAVALNAAASVADAAWNDKEDLALIVAGGALADVSAGGFVGGTVLDATGVGAIAGVPIQVVSGIGIAAGTTLMATGAAGIGKAADADRHSVVHQRSSEPPDPAPTKRNGLSNNQMNETIKKGQAPRGITRIDLGKVRGEQEHATFDDNSALNVDGTWKHGGRTLTDDQKQWLSANGWKLP